MRRGAVLRMDPAARLSIGLMALVACLLLIADAFLGIAPGRADTTRSARQQLSESLAVHVAALLEAGDEKTLGTVFQHLAVRNPDVLSLAARSREGGVVGERGDHSRHWVFPVFGPLTEDHLRVPLYSNRSHWGDLEIAFAPTAPRGYRAWLTQPWVLAFALVCVGGIPLFYAYLRRALQYLDPSAAVPDRVRKAFDTLSDAILVLDRDGRIVLANQPFRNLHPESDRNLLGQRIAALPWLAPSLGARGGGDAPWDRALRDAAPVSGGRLTIRRPDAPPVETIVNCAPITDGRGRARGCLVSFDDVTEVHRANDRLREALTELELSREQIKAQNEELRRLATRDPLTGCFNRRAFFDAAAELFPKSVRANAGLCCIMADIDHFKSFNDLYGHAVGDQVIRSVAHLLGAGLREGDILCRYGGEEFCILLPGATPEQVREIAEQLRVAIEKRASSSIRSTQVVKITSSFGVASIDGGASTVEELIDQADNALYASKEAGRNRVTVCQRRDAGQSGGAQATP